MNNTSIRIQSSESVTFAAAGSKKLSGPTGNAPRTTYFLYVFNTADPLSSTSFVYLIAKDSADTNSALVVKPGESAGFGPFRLDNLNSDIPDLYASDATTAICTWVPVISEK